MLITPYRCIPRVRRHLLCLLLALAALSFVHVFQTPIKSVSSIDVGLFEERGDFEAAFAALLTIQPSESNVRHLLSALPGPEDGRESIFEVGERTRQYSVYFDAWSKLHFRPTQAGRVELRDDVLEYLHTARGADFAKSLNRTSSGLAHFYEAFQQFISTLGNDLFPFQPHHMAHQLSLYKQFHVPKHESRGIVLTGGNDHVPHLMTNILSLRQLGCILPIELLYMGDNDMSRANRLKLENLGGVIARDLSQLIDDSGWEISAFAIKPFAIMFSSFREVLFLDADALFFRDPTTLFDDPGYVDTGALFFVDRMIFPESKRGLMRELLPPPISEKARRSRFWTGKSGHYQESGVLVIDKKRHFLQMMMTCRMNGPDGRVSTQFMYGDKETYWLSWELSGSSDYDFHGGPTGALGVFSWDSDDKSSTYSICSPHLLHADREGKPLWFNGWLAKSRHVDDDKKTVSSFGTYAFQPSEEEYTFEQHGDVWKLLEGNVACLMADTIFALSAEENATLDMLVKTARSVGAVD